MLVALALQVAAVTIPSPPFDWSGLPPLRVPRTEASAAVADFVRDEVRAGRCTATQPGSIAVDLAIYVTGDGKVRRIVPRAINCPTVEQYASGIALRTIRGKIEPPKDAGWHRMAVTFVWQ